MKNAFQLQSLVCQRQIKDALCWIHAQFRAKPAIERYADARRIAAGYLRDMRHYDFYTLTRWREDKKRYLYKLMQGF